MSDLRKRRLATSIMWGLSPLLGGETWRRDECGKRLFCVLARLLGGRKHEEAQRTWFGWDWDWTGPPGDRYPHPPSDDRPASCLPLHSLDAAPLGSPSLSSSTFQSYSYSYITSPNHDAPGAIAFVSSVRRLGRCSSLAQPPFARFFCFCFFFLFVCFYPSVGPCRPFPALDELV